MIYVEKFQLQLKKKKVFSSLLLLTIRRPSLLFGKSICATTKQFGKVFFLSDVVWRQEVWMKYVQVQVQTQNMSTECNLYFLRDTYIYICNCGYHIQSFGLGKVIETFNITKLIFQVAILRKDFLHAGIWNIRFWFLF